MNEELVERLRLGLLQKKSELAGVAETASEAEQVVELDQSRVGRLSRVDAMQAQQMAQASARRREELLQQIEGALRRIDSGEFGYCFVCGEEIDPRRLEADPATTRCLGCVED